MDELLVDGGKPVSEASVTETPAATPAPAATETKTEVSVGSEAAPKTTEAAAKSGEVGGDKSVIPPGAQVVPPAFEPNFKFKAYKQEYELPELFRGLVKDSKTQEEVIKVFEKAYGFDQFKEIYDKNRVSLEQVQAKVEKEYKPLLGNVQQAAYFLKQKDYDSLFEHIGVPKDDVLGWVHQKLQEMDLPPQLQSQLEQTRKINRDNWNLMQQNQVLSQQVLTHSEQTTLTSLQTALTKPDVKAVADAYDARTGKPGSFMRECINRGEYLELKGQSPSAEQVVSELLAVLGPPSAPNQVQSGVSGAAAQTQPGHGQVQVTKTTSPPVIPNVGGQNTSPTRKLPRSIEDLRKLSREYQPST